MTNDPQIPPTPLPVEVVAFPDVQLLDVTGPYQVLASANDAADAAVYAPVLVSPRPGVFASSSGLRMVAEPLSAADAPIDTLIVAGGEGVYSASEDAALVGWIKARAACARRVASVCSGAFLLAAAGLLDGRRAATHWSRAAALASRFPRVQVEADPIYIQDGPVWTSAGVTAGIDLALALVEADLGRRIATSVARHLVVFARRPGGQTQFSAGLALEGRDERFESLHAWMRDHLRGDLSVPSLAERAGMSERSFLRRYRDVTGSTPARAVEMIRVEAARQALGATGLPIKQIARDCGFGSEETMRRGFLRYLSVTPQAYRERFPV